MNRSVISLVFIPQEGTSELRGQKVVSDDEWLFVILSYFTFQACTGQNSYKISEVRNFQKWLWLSSKHGSFSRPIEVHVVRGTMSLH